MLRALVYFVGEKKVVAKISKQCAPYIVRWGWIGARGTRTRQFGAVRRNRTD
jgi:hypothetical protein